MNVSLLSNLVITKVHSAYTLYTPRGTKQKRTDRSRWAIILKHEGETVYTCREKHFLSDLRHVILIPCGCSYEWLCTETGHCCIVEFESETKGDEPISFSVKNGERFLKMFKELEYRRTLGTPTAAMEGIRDAYSILLALLQSEGEAYFPGSKQKKIAPAIEYISKHYNAEITNDMLASIAGVSTVYFRKLFVGTLGISPIAYVHRLRTEKAKEMLDSDYGTLSDVAQALGYSSLYDFSRDFKKHTGVAPSKYKGR